jgi:hypothetical protein
VIVRARYDAVMEMTATRSMLDAAESTHVAERIGALATDTPAQWGKMNSAQMLAHCQVPLRIALGDEVWKRAFLGYLLGGLVKKMLVGPKPFKPNGPTDPRFVVKDERDFDTEKAGLCVLIERFAAGGRDGVTKNPHPFFGAMQVEEWDGLMWKHLDHHLRQFGC